MNRNIVYVCSLFFVFFLGFSLQSRVLVDYWYSPDDFVAYTQFSKEIEVTHNTDFVEHYWQKSPPNYRLSPLLFIVNYYTKAILDVSYQHSTIILSMLQYLVLTLFVFVLLNNLVDLPHGKKYFLLILTFFILFLLPNKNLTIGHGEIFTHIWYLDTSIFSLISILTFFVLVLKNKEYLAIIMLISAFSFNLLRTIQIVGLAIPILLYFALRNKEAMYKSLLKNMVVASLVFFSLTSIFLLLDKSLAHKFFEDLFKLLYQNKDMVDIFVNEVPIINFLQYISLPLSVLLILGWVSFLKEHIRRGVKESLFLYLVSFITLVSITLGWITPFFIPVKFQSLLLLIVYIAAPISIYYTLKLFTPRLKVVVILFLSLFLIVTNFNGLDNLDDKKINAWLLERGYVDFLEREGNKLEPGYTYISDPITNYIFSSLTLKNTAFYSPRSNIDRTCTLLKEGQIESKNVILSKEISKLFNLESSLDFEVLKNNNVRYIIFEKRYLAECKVDILSFETFIQQLILEGKIRKVDCFKDQVCIFEIL